MLWGTHVCDGVPMYAMGYTCMQGGGIPMYAMGYPCVQWGTHLCSEVPMYAMGYPWGGYPCM